ncbi:MAG TPA: Crp/Fnr family transcriptional regulator [Gemmatirosa sp.]
MSTHSPEEASPAAVRRDGAGAAHATERNRVLRALPLEDYAWLLPQLTPVRLRLRQVLVEPNVPIQDVHFVRDGVASMLATEQDGGAIEVGTIGCEGLVGLPVLLGAESMSNRVIVQVEGEAWRLSADACRRALDERTAARRLCLRYAAFFTGQLSQAVACNRLHNLEERCARWLLMTHDRVNGDAFDLTHEFLSLMLGVRRAGVSVAMGILQRAGLVQYTRGRVTILDRPGLEEASCTCYQITRRALDGLLG